MTTLQLTLKRGPFNLMVTGEKRQEYRTPSQWILSRLVGKDYDEIKFTNGYGKDKPWFTCEYAGYYIHNGDSLAQSYSDGRTIIIEEGTVVIELGKILEVGNYE